MAPSGQARHALKSRRWPIQRLVWPFVMLLVLTGWIAIGVLVRAEREEAERAAITRAQDRATLLEQHVVKTLQVAALASLHVGHLYLVPDRGESQRRIDEPTADIAGLSGVTIWHHDGRTLAASGMAYSRPGQDPQARPPAIPPRSDIVVTGPHALGPSGQKAILVTSRIKHDGRTAGYVGLSFKPDQFLNFPIRTAFDATDLVSVIGLNGVTLARREGNSFSSGQNVADGLVMRKQHAEPNGTYLGPSSLDGHVRYFSHRRLVDFPIFVTAGVSHSAALAGAQRRAVFYYGILSILSALGILIAWLVQREVAERERKAAELAETAERLQEAQRIGKIGDWEYDPATELIIWSDELCEMYERSCTDDRLTFEEFLTYLVPEDRPRIEADLRHLMDQGGTQTSEFQVVLPSGKTVHRCANAIAVRNDKGEISRLFGTDQDVTQDHLFRELERQVAHLDRQGAMSMMAGTLAHELNQPLTAAKNYITGALRSVGNAGGSAQGLVANGMRQALEQINDAAEIIRRARKMVQVEADSSRTASVREVIASTIALLKASGFAGVQTIRVECKREIPNAQISRIQLQQVLVNLLKNALEAVAPDDASITIRVARVDPGQLRIEIADNGPGFPDTIDAFSPFYSNKLTGLGLGLSISRTIIEHHAGKLWIEKSAPGETLIVILLPISSERAESDPAGEASRATSARSRPGSRPPPAQAG